MGVVWALAMPNVQAATRAAVVLSKKRFFIEAPIKKMTLILIKYLAIRMPL
jgi:hypothetical protein